MYEMYKFKACIYSEANEGVPRSAPVSGAVGASVVSAAGLGTRAWYYGAISRTHCDAILNQHGHDGDFLIRDSETNVSRYIYIFRY